MATRRGPQDRTVVTVDPRAVVDEHRTSPLSGLCVICDEPGPCTRRSQAALRLAAEALGVADLLDDARRAA
jgi:hypothetical protein